MNKAIYVTLALIVPVICYCFGYRQGGHDFAYLDHITIGMLANSEIQRCDKGESPKRCYKWTQELSISHAFIFYTQHSNKLSPAAQYIFPESHEAYLRAVKSLYDLASTRGPDSLCEYAHELGESEYSKCKNEINLFIQMANAQL